MNHREKLRLARRNMSLSEIKRKGKGPFESSFWENRAFRIKLKIAKKQRPELMGKLGL